MGGVGDSYEFALSVGGQTSPGYVGNNELWNGSNWTEVGDLNTGRGTPGESGNAAAALVAGGSSELATSITPKTESWNGTNWTELNDLNVTRTRLGGTGSNTSSLAFGGETPPNTAATEEWNSGVALGAWVTGADIPAGREALAGAGTSKTSGIAFGGMLPATTGTTQIYDGVSWAEINDMNTGRNRLGGTGSTTAALAVGGSEAPSPAKSAKVESWNGYVWAEVNDLNAAKRFIPVVGTSTSALAFGGEGPTDQTELWT
jgi:hypothetical protein